MFGRSQESVARRGEVDMRRRRRARRQSGRAEDMVDKTDGIAARPETDGHRVLDLRVRDRDAGDDVTRSVEGDASHSE